MLRRVGSSLLYCATSFWAEPAHLLSPSNLYNAAPARLATACSFKQRAVAARQRGSAGSARSVLHRCPVTTYDMPSIRVHYWKRRARTASARTRLDSFGCVGGHAGVQHAEPCALPPAQHAAPLRQMVQILCPGAMAEAGSSGKPGWGMMPACATSRSFPAWTPRQPRK